MEQKPMPDVETDVDAAAEVSDEGTVKVEREVEIQTGGVSVEKDDESEAEPKEG